MGRYDLSGRDFDECRIQKVQSLSSVFIAGEARTNMKRQYYIFAASNPAQGRRLYKYLLDFADFDSFQVHSLSELRKELSEFRDSVVLCIYEDDLQSVRWLCAELACPTGFQPRIFAIPLPMENDASWSSEKICQLAKELTDGH